jgi:hypothetical protein
MTSYVAIRLLRAGATLCRASCFRFKNNSDMSIDLIQSFVCNSADLDQMREITSVISKHDTFAQFQQYSITSKGGFDIFDGICSLYSYEMKKFINFTDEYTAFNSEFKNTAFEKVYKIVQDVAKKDGVQIGRTRLLRLNPKTCYSLHKDIEEFRYHVPITSNKSCFFVIADKIFKMPQVGSLYRFYTKETHTAVNASFEIRDHLVFDTYIAK